MGLFTPRDRRGNKHLSWAEAHKANALYDMADHARLEQQWYWASPEGQKHSQEIEEAKGKIVAGIFLTILGLAVLYYMIKYWYVVLLAVGIGFGVIWFRVQRKTNSINGNEKIPPKLLTNAGVVSPNGRPGMTPRTKHPSLPMATRRAPLRKKRPARKPPNP